jgi:hypothetical protein
MKKRNLCPSIQDGEHPGVGIKKTKQSPSAHGHSQADFYHAWPNSTLLDGANVRCANPDRRRTFCSVSSAACRTVYLRSILEYAVKPLDHRPEVAQ